MEHDLAIRTAAAERYFLGEMDDDEAEDFEEHFFACTRCGEHLLALEAVIGALREILR